MSVDILKEDEARKIKADNLVPPNPPQDEYELRIVLWNSRDVRFPKEKDQVIGCLVVWLFGCLARSQYDCVSSSTVNPVHYMVW